MSDENEVITINDSDFIELIKKYSFFYANDFNTFTEEKNDKQKYSFLSDTKYKHSSIITLNKLKLKIQKNTPLLAIEKKLYKEFMTIINKYKKFSLSKHEYEILFEFAQIKAILSSFFTPKKEPKLFSFLLSHIKKMENWASQTYENQGISFCLGIDYTENEENIKLTEIYDEPLCKVFTNGIETMIVCNQFGNVIDYRTNIQVIHEKTESKSDENIKKKIKTQNEIITPHIFEWLANWTAIKNRIVIHLNSRGEILLFHNGSLAFAKRNSKWHVTKLSPLSHLLPETLNYNKEMKTALTQTCIDVTFRRTGACIGILNNETDIQQLIDKQDILKNSRSSKIVFLNQIINNKKFQDLPRELRQELVAVDGATILDKNGNILAIGAILNLNSELSETINEKRQGGRSTAAKQLACFGVGIKVSADGGISAWQKCKESSKINKFFELF